MGLADSLGSILLVDLDSRQVSRKAVEPEWAGDYLGGWGLSSRLACEHIPQGVEPLSPENPVIFGAGLLGGTIAPASSKVMATTRFPITRAIGTAVGGSCGDAIRLAGYSHIVVRGEASHPVVLRIFDGEVALEDASWLWGKDIADTTDELRGRYGQECSVICIGQAGENQAGVSFAYANRLGHLGQGGLGAVLGQKKLKAILLRGTGGLPMADRKAFTRVSDAVRERMLSLPYRSEWLEIGPGIASWGYRSQRPKLTPEQEAAAAFGPAAYDKIYRGPVACPSCPLACKFLLEMRYGERAGQLAVVTGAGSSWEKFNVGDIHHTLELRDFCNRWGIDDQETTALIDFAIRLFEGGVISKEECDGMELRRDYTTAKALLRKIALREGLGDVLADGLGKAVERIGRGADRYAAVLKGRAAGDPRRHFHAMSITEVVNPRGYNSVASNGPGFVPGHSPETFRTYLRRNVGLPEKDIDRICSDDNVNMARLARHAEDLYGVSSSLGICVRQPVGQSYNIGLYAQLYAAFTGEERSPEELKKAGERAWNLIKTLNVREGFTRTDDGFVDKLFEPLQVGDRTFTFTDYYGHPIDRAAAERLLDDYYAERGWDVATGVPTEEKLEELGLGFAVGHRRLSGVSPG